MNPVPVTLGDAEIGPCADPPVQMTWKGNLQSTLGSCSPVFYKASLLVVIKLRPFQLVGSALEVGEYSKSGICAHPINALTPCTVSL